MKYIIIAMIFILVYLLTGQVDWRLLVRKIFQEIRSWTLIPLPAQRGKSQNPPLSSFATYLFSAGGGALLGFLFGGSPLKLGTYAWSLFAAAWGCFFCWLGWKWRAKNYSRLLETQLPDALELIANSLRAGLSLVQSLEVVAQEAQPPMANEFLALTQDCRLGLPAEEALEKFLSRFPNQALELFVIAAEVSLRTGSNLAEVIGRIIATIRERSRLSRRIDTLTAQGRLSGWVVGLLPLGLLAAMTILDSDLMVGFFRHPLGWILMALGIGMELIGAFFIRRIVQIDI